MSTFQFGNISGTNVQVGDNNAQNVTMNQADRELILSLLGSLREEIQQAPIPDETKKELAEQVLPKMQDAAKQPDPKPGLTQGLEHLSANLEKANTAAGSLAGIVGTVAKIAGVIGTGVRVAAPFLAGLL